MCSRTTAGGSVDQTDDLEPQRCRGAFGDMARCDVEGFRAGSRTYISLQAVEFEAESGGQLAHHRTPADAEHPGCSSIGISSIGLPKPITSNITVALS